MDVDKIDINLCSCEKPIWSIKLAEKKKSPGSGTIL